MIGCIVINEVKGAEINVRALLKGMLEVIEWESRCKGNDQMILFGHVCDRIEIWQMIMNLEANHISAGYGFGETKEEAKRNALHHLDKIVGHMP